MNDCESEEREGYMVKIEVNVTKIVKYVCITGVLIVGCIFGEKCFRDFVGSRFKADHS
ncbi:MAG: hypothetical protein J5979_06270 [Lachnospiraceae bacterium]|nr:hypothetical protein [Lachnospiraceae bacterium]